MFLIEILSLVVVVLGKVPAMKEAFYFRGGQAACLLIHGFASTPSEVRWLGEKLHQQGFTTQGVMLTGHGVTPEDLARTQWSDWYHSAEEAFLELKQRYEIVFVIGVSMGGLLALMLAANYPNHVTAVVTAGTPGGRRFFRDRRIHLAAVAKYFVPYQERRVPADIKKLHEEMGRVYYSKRPLAAVHSLLKLVDSTIKLLPRVTCPTLIMHSRSDDVIHWQSAPFIKKHLSNARLGFVENSAHIITVDQEREKVLMYIEGFFREIMEEEGVMFEFD